MNNNWQLFICTYFIQISTKIPLNQKILGSVEYQKYKNDEKILHVVTKKTEDLLSDILEYNQNYPQCFIDNPEGYFIYESISSLSIVDCEEILKDSELLRKNIKGVESFNDDFSISLEVGLKILILL